MIDVMVRGLREDVAHFLQSEANAAGRNLEDELRRVLTEPFERAEVIRRIDEGREALRQR